MTGEGYADAASPKSSRNIKVVALADGLLSAEAPVRVGVAPVLYTSEP
jgi:hypothetical protein